MTRDASEPLLIKVAEAARIIGISPRRLYDLAARGALPPGMAIRFGRSVRVSRPRLLAWLGRESKDEGPVTRGPES
ncbi:MAG TPA: helix-turn-helix domain-containing protein [bacterium]|nr:helix-turn-helix domain-containing protein [bacterium]